MNLELLQKIRDSSFNYELVKKQKSNDFVGVYLHSGSPFLKKDHEGPIRYLRVMSEYEYPLYLFIDMSAITNDLDYIYDNYGDIKVITIPKLTNAFEYNYFFFNNVFKLLPSNYNRVITLQDDGFPIQKNWEDYVVFHDFDYVGAPFRADITVLTKEGELTIPRTSNGGMSARKLSSILKVIDYVNSHGGQLKYFKGIRINNKLMQNNGYLAEDAMFSSVGFNKGFFKPVTLKQAAKFALEPLSFRLFNDFESKNRPYAMHKVDF